MAQLGVNQMSESAMAELEARYNDERDKRLKSRPQGEAQFIDLSTSEKFKYLHADPWIKPDDHTTIPSSIDVSKPIKYLIVGTGYSGLLFAVRLLQAGAKLDEMVLVDASGGYGGVWYWNRYPGLMCDVESYIYMPLLQELEYMPKHKYSYGPELRAHAERIADHWKLRDRTIFRQQATDMSWDTTKNEWIIKTKFAGDRRDLDLTLHAKYTLVSGGQMTKCKIPDVEGLDKFQGHIFHTSRWNYSYTGGDSTQDKADLVNLRDKTVGIIGTGATAVQSIPVLAEWAKKLVVFQRTPSSCDERNQHETDPEEWKRVVSPKEWWTARNLNFSEHIHQKQPLPADNLVKDQWVVNNPSYGTSWGYDNPLSAEDIPAYVRKLHTDDIPRGERLRKRVDDIVKDKETATKLKHYYPSWCKRPCFHDDYLPAFNKPNVLLVDTEGRGVDRFTEKGVVANGQEYELDLLILSTGFKVLFPGLSPAARYGINITGKDGQDMATTWLEDLATLHGLVSRGFPNMFFTGLPQASLTVNQIHNMDVYARHVAYMIFESQRKAGVSEPVIEPTKEAQDDWGDQTAANALGLAGTSGCTPSYLNMEGELDKMMAMGPEVQAKVMRTLFWGRGINHYAGKLEDWRNEGSLKGLEITA